MHFPPLQPLPSAVPWLGYGGLVPFFGLCVLVIGGVGDATQWTQAVLAYAAVILSFVGALHWAFAMLLPALSPAETNRAYVWSTVPALVGWLGMLIPPGLALPILCAAFVVHFLMDRQLAARHPLPPWYLPLRRRLTLWVVSSLLAVWVRVGLAGP